MLCDYHLEILTNVSLNLWSACDIGWDKDDYP